MATRRRYKLVALSAAILACAAGAAGAAGTHGPGSLDTSFGRSGTAVLGAGTRVLGLATLHDGKFLAVGESGVPNNTRLLLARFTATGSLDHSFGHHGVVIGPKVPTRLGTGSIGRAVATEPDGKIVVVGTATDHTGTARDGLLIERYNANGALDRNFGAHGVVNLLNDSFGDGYAVAIQPDGKILAAGSDNAAGSGNGDYPRVAVVRLTAGGGLDRSFGTGGIDVIDLGPYSYALAVALQRDGKLVIAGSQSPGLQATNALVARLTGSGKLDRSFGGTGYYAHQYAPTGGAFSSFQGVAVLPGGGIVADGEASAANESADAFVVRFSARGARSSSFGQGGIAYATSARSWLESNDVVPGARSIALGPGGELIAAGQYADSIDTSIALWAFTAGGHPVHGFGSDGTAVLRLASSNDTDAAAVALGADGTAIVAGDENQLGRKFAGLVAAYRLK
jgi:uncharacterized delta-60 repeat protein